MFVENLRQGFYDVIIGKRVLVLVSFDVDALCACKILQHLMQCDHVVYSIVPVSGVDSMREAFMTHSEQVKHVVFINCAATVSLIDVLNPDEDVIMFVIDSRRPIDVYNIYNANQIRLLMPVDDVEGDVPELDDVYRDDLESDEDEDDDDENVDEAGLSRRERLHERRINKREERRNWEQKRDKLLFDYTQFSYYGTSSALLLFELAWKMSRDNNDLLWWAAIGLTDQLVHHKIDQTKYVLQAGTLQRHISRLNHKNDGENKTSVHCIKLAFDKDLQLDLYRHWNLYDSLKHTNYMACVFRLWTLKGEKRLHEFLAELGLPLAQCKQRYSSMDLTLRNNVRQWIEDKIEKYGLDGIVRETFTAQFGFRHKFCAADYVFAASALLESDRSKSTTECFLDSLDCLARSKLNTLQTGIDLARKQMSAVFAQVQTFLDLNQVISVGPFLYVVVSESAPDSSLFSHPICLSSLAHSLLRAHVTVSRSRKAKNLPLVLTAPGSEGGRTLVIGIPPVSEDSAKNLFGQAFIQASESARTKISNHFFDTHIVEIESDSNCKFFDALISLLQ